MTNARYLGIVALLSVARAHETMWHPAMYGWEAKDDRNPMLPLSKLAFKDWWFHGNIDSPPPDDQMLEIPSGGTFTADIHCGREKTRYGSGPPSWTPSENDYLKGEWVDRVCPPHSTDTFEKDPMPKDAKGCSIAIAYESDPHKVKPEDVTVISTNYTCPWFLHTDFSFPPDLPPCPPGGCHCFWGWVHSAGPGAGAPDQMYHTAYRCNVTNANPAACPLPKPQPARKCPQDKNNCTIGAKQPFYWAQNEANNNWQNGGDPPFYNDEYGYMNGPQMDLWLADVDHSEYDDKNDSQWAPQQDKTYWSDFTIPASTAYTKPAPTSLSTCAGNTAQAAVPTWMSGAGPAAATGPAGSAPVPSGSAIGTSAATSIATSVASANSSSFSDPTETPTGVDTEAPLHETPTPTSAVASSAPPTDVNVPTHLPTDSALSDVPGPVDSTAMTHQLTPSAVMSTATPIMPTKQCKRKKARLPAVGGPADFDVV